MAKLPDMFKDWSDGQIDDAVTQLDVLNLDPGWRILVEYMASERDAMLSTLPYAMGTPQEVGMAQGRAQCIDLVMTMRKDILDALREELALRESPAEEDNGPKPLGDNGL